MTTYQFHFRPHGGPLPLVALEAESHRHGAALALRQFVSLGCDLTAPLAHVDVTEANGAQTALLVEEVVDWLKEEPQTAFVAREGLSVLMARG